LLWRINIIFFAVETATQKNGNNWPHLANLGRQNKQQAQLLNALVPANVAQFAI